MEPIVWQAYEHSFFEKDKEWFYAFAITVGCVALTFVILGNFFFGLVIVLGAVCLGMLANVPPELHDFELSDKGLKIGKETHRFEEMLAFWVDDDEARDEPILLVDTKKFSLPNIVIPLVPEHTKDIRDFFKSKSVEEKPMKETLAHQLIEFFGF